MSYCDNKMKIEDENCENVTENNNTRDEDSRVIKIIEKKTNTTM